MKTSVAALFVLICTLLSGGVRGSDLPNAKIVKTYMSFSSPIDPSNILTQADLDISHSLASTLIEWDEAMQPTAALASSWESEGESKVAIHLKPNAKWSDGSLLSAREVVASFDRAKRVHGDSLDGLFSMVKQISAENSQTVIFELKVPVSKSGIYRKLTEPMYGVLAVENDGSLDLKKSSGPFAVQLSSPSEIQLVANRHWFGFDPAMADRIIIKSQMGSQNPEAALSDQWANLTPSSSLVPETIAAAYESAHISVLKRNLDKIFLLIPSQRLSNSNGRNLLRSLASRLDPKEVLKGVSGATISQQFYPPGYALFNPAFPAPTNESVPPEFRSKLLTLLMVDSVVGNLMKKGLVNAVREATGQTPMVRSVALGDLEKERVAGKYDLAAISIPVNDLDLDGAMSFFFGIKPPLIPTAGEGKNNFKLRIEQAKALENQSARNAEYRNVMTDATASGCLLPLFHYSTVVLAKNGLKISQKQTTDETIAFAKVRFP
jgi:MarR-like DNA-binding transcriptional regulator SgrR of sgrS sRNA